MRKVYVLGFALLALSIAGATVVLNASADEYLVNGEQPKAEQELSAESELLLEDMKGGIFGEAVMVLCSLEWLWLIHFVSSPPWLEILLDNIYPVDGKDEVDQKIPCTSQAGICGESTVKGIHMPWLSELQLVGSAWRATILTSGEGTPAFSVECSKVVEDECAGETTVSVTNGASGELISEFDAISNEKPTNCTRGGAGTGLIEGVTLAFSVGGTLSVS